MTITSGTQTAVDLSLAVGLKGLLVDGAPHYIRSYVSESTAETPFGVMVQQGTGDHQCKILAATTDKLIGIVVRSQVYDKPNELGDTGLKQYVTVGVLRRGVIWVWAEEAVTPASAVLVRAVATGNEVAGDFRDSADASDTIDVSHYCRFLTSTTGAALVQLEVDMNGFLS